MITNSDNQTAIADLHKKGEELAEAGLIADAEILYKQIIALAPDDLDAVISLGNIGFHLGNIRQAVQYYLKAVSLNPDNNELVMSVSCMLMDLGHPVEAGRLTDAFFAGERNLLLERVTEIEVQLFG